MKSARRPLKRSVEALEHRILGGGGRSSAVRAGGKGPARLSRHALDPERLLHFSQQLYAHALTLQEVIRNEGKEAYEALRPRFDRQAAEQFEAFFHRSGSRTRSAAYE